MTRAGSINTSGTSSPRTEQVALHRKDSGVQFRTRSEVEKYFGNRTIKCLLCGKKFGRLASHLAFKHGMRADEYKARYGLPWSRGLTSSVSQQNSGWDAQRRAKARKLARKTRFFRYAHPSSRREDAPYVKQIYIRNLGERCVGFGKQFERDVRKLFDKGLVDREIAVALSVNIMTVNRRTRKWRQGRSAHD